MKLQKTTWFLLLLAISLGVFVYIIETKSISKQEKTQVEKQKIFEFQESEIVGLTIEKDGKILEFVKTDREFNPWQMQKPKDVPASDAYISYLLDLLTDSNTERSFILEADKQKEYGLDKPLAKIKIKLKSQANYQLILGNPSFDDRFLYAQKNQEAKIILVSKQFQYAVARELKEWQEPEKP